MKVLLVTHRYPPRTGGVENHVQELATRLADRGHEVTVFSADGGNHASSRSSEANVCVRRFRSLHPGEAFYFAPQIAKAVLRFSGEVVHAHNYHALPQAFAALGISEERFVVTPHYHGGSASRVRNSLLSLYRPVGRLALAAADRIVAVSEWERSKLESDFGVDATVIPNGVDVDRFSRAIPENRETPYVLCVGRLEEYKGVQHVIRALPRLPGVDLVVAGDGPYRTQLETLAREENLASRVEFLGFVNEERLPGLYAGATLYITLSTFEAYGLTVGEALAAGTPAVVRTEGALTDWVEHDGVRGIDGPEDLGTSLLTWARETGAPDTTLPTWAEVVDRVEAVYRD